MDAAPALGAWSNFFVMTGSSAAALTGLMFVVTSLIRERPRASRELVGMFSTPTVMHFACVLLASAVLLAPWHVLWHATVAVGIIGLFGLGYVVRAVVHALRMSGDYSPDLEDWIWFTVMPFGGYAAVLAGALILYRDAWGFFVVAAGSMLLMFIGIRNSWDIITYTSIFSRDDEP
jgi:hypothetical protein